MNLKSIKIYILFLCTNVWCISIDLSDIQSKWRGVTFIALPNQFITQNKAGNNNPIIFSKKIKRLSLVKQIVKLKCRLNNLENYQGFELRFSSDPEFKKFIAFSIPRFTDPSFNIIQSNFWQSYTFGLGNAKVFGGQDPKNVSYMGIYIQSKGAGFLEFNIKDVEINPALLPSIITFTFDDGYIDHYNAAKIMNSHGLNGTAYIMPRQIGKSEYLSLNQLKKMKEVYNWGISSHHDTPFTEFIPADLQKEIKYTLKYLTNNGFGKSAPHLAYPLGKQDRIFVLPIVKNHFLTARVASGGMETLPPADRGLIRTFNVLSSTNPKEVNNLIKLAKENGQWLILMFHYLVPKTKRDTDYSIDNFKKIVKSVKASKILVMPIHQVWNEYLLPRQKD